MRTTACCWEYRKNFIKKEKIELSSRRSVETFRVKEEGNSRFCVRTGAWSGSKEDDA